LSLYEKEKNLLSQGRVRFILPQLPVVKGKVEEKLRCFKVVKAGTGAYPYEDNDSMYMVRHDDNSSVSTPG